MSWLDALAEEYLIPEPKGFTYVAARLKAGVPPLQIRAEIIENTGASKLAAGKLVEQSEKAIKLAKGNMISGIVLLGLALVWLLLFGDLRAVIPLVAGPVQFTAGRKVWTIYRQAGRPAQPASG